MHQRVLAADWCVQGGLEDIASMALGGDVTPPRAVLAIGIHPKVATPWIFVLHQCSYARTWDSEEERLFVEIGHRLADALTSLIAYDLQRAAHGICRDLSPQSERATSRA
jgi:hypothetical protein